MSTSGLISIFFLFIHLCRLLDHGKESVTLYVGHENSARRVYHRVGFVGLSGKLEDRPEDVEDALELGFVGTNRGHW